MAEETTFAAELDGSNMVMTFGTSLANVFNGSIIKTYNNHQLWWAKDPNTHPDATTFKYVVDDNTGDKMITSFKMFGATREGEVTHDGYSGTASNHCYVFQAFGTTDQVWNLYRVNGTTTTKIASTVSQATLVADDEITIEADYNSGSPTFVIKRNGSEILSHEDNSHPVPSSLGRFAGAATFASSPAGTVGLTSWGWEPTGGGGGGASAPTQRGRMTLGLGL